MIIMTTYAVGDIPFKDVYLHGLIRDEKGKKMSKSLGNVIDPLDMIKKYGADATRLSLVMGSTPGNDMSLSEEKIAGFRNFANKLWNIARYIITNYKLRITNYKFKESELTQADWWIMIKFQTFVKQVTDDLENYRFSQAGERLREFTWDDLADWYLEVCKFEKSGEKSKILSHVFEGLLKLWHPFIPFVTEAIWQEMDKDKMLIIESWPQGAATEHFVGSFDLIKNVITAIRNVRAENKVEPAKKIKAVIYAGDKTELVKSQEVLIKNLRTGIAELKIGESGPKIEKAIYITVGDIEIYLIGALDEEKEKARIEKEIENFKKFVKGVKMKLNNKEFVAKAPAAVVNKEKEKLAGWEMELKKLNEQLKRLA